MRIIKIEIPYWRIEEETGYKPFTTFWQDFSIADNYGLQAIQDTFNRQEATMKTLFFDVMLNGRFVCTLRYKYCPLFPIEIDELVKLVLSKRPTLKGKPFRIAF